MKLKIKNVLYLGWLGKGNVGDDVLFELFKIMFYSHTQLNDRQIAVNIATFPIIQNYKIDLSTYDLIILGGGSLIHLPYWLHICEEAIKQGVPVVSWGSGFDDKYKPNDFETLTMLQENTSRYTTLFDQFSYLSVRGFYTEKVLRNINVKNEIDVIGDPALLYAKEIFGNRLPDKKETKEILVNWGTSYHNVFGNNELVVEKELIIAIHYLLEKDYQVKIYPIWTEDIPAVKRLAEKVNDARCSAQLVVYDANTLQKMINNSYFTINFKLHANILAAAVNKPFLSLAYRGKCFDFAQTVQCEKYAIATDDITADKLIHVVDEIRRNYDDIVGTMEQAKQLYYPKIVQSIQKIYNILI